MDSPALEHRAFRMKLNPGQATEYRRRHDAIWPEISALLHDAGVCDYRIYLDEETHILFAAMTVTADNSVGDLRHKAIMKRWWTMMADIMETNDDLSPREAQLEPMFALKGPDQA